MPPHDEQEEDFQPASSACSAELKGHMYGHPCPICGWHVASHRNCRFFGMKEDPGPERPQVLPGDPVVPQQ